MAELISEQRELDLVNKLELRIALADSEKKLEGLLNTFLAPLLLKLNSEHQSVRTKVLEVCQHINKRVKSNDVKLPVRTLLEQCKEHVASSLIRNLDLHYVQMGIQRLSSPDRASLLSILLPGIAATASKVSPQHAAVIFNLVLRSFRDFHFPSKGSPEDQSLRQKYMSSEEDACFLAFWMSKLILLRLGTAGSNDTLATCPGLSPEEYAFLTLHGKNGTWNPSLDTGLSLTSTKVLCVKILFTGLFSPHERLLPALYASANQNSTISDRGEDLMKATFPEIDVSQDPLVDNLLDAYLGLKSGLVPVDAPVRIKILSLLSKSATCLARGDRVIHVVENDLINRVARSNTDRETLKLRTAVVTFLHSIVRVAKNEELKPISGSILDILKSFLDQQHESGLSELRNVRSQCFEVFATLADAAHERLVEPHLEILRWLFRSLSEEKDKEICLSISSAISATMRPFQTSLSPDVKQALEECLFEQLESESLNAQSIRYAAVKFANNCFDFEDISARWIDVLALGMASTETNELVEEARKGLDPYWFRTTREFASHAQASPQSAGEQTWLSFPKLRPVLEYILPKHYTDLQNRNVLVEAVAFVRLCLAAQVLKRRGMRLQVEQDWSRKLDLAISEDFAVRDTMRIEMNELSKDEKPLSVFIELWNLALENLGTTPAKTNQKLLQFLHETTISSPDSVLKILLKNVKRIRAVALSTHDFQLKIDAAHLWGLLASTDKIDENKSLLTSVEELLTLAGNWSTAYGAEGNKTSGSILALSYLASRKRLRNEDSSLVSRLSERLMNMSWEACNKGVDGDLLRAFFEASSQLFRHLAIGKELFTSIVSVEAYIDKILKTAKVGNEKAITLLGDVSIILDEEEDSKVLTKLIDQIRELHDIRQPETQFTVGEALACVASSWESKALKMKFDMEGYVPSTPPRTLLASQIVEKVLKDSSITKPALKKVSLLPNSFYLYPAFSHPKVFTSMTNIRVKASTIWLLCMLQFCEEDNAIQSHLKDFQIAFKRCLTDRDELVQESASRGLGLVYDKGSSDMKESLVKDLIGSFSNDKANLSGTVSEDTQLFESGALPTGDGSITTYKDIMSLASEVGDPSLVYRFMSLASNNAIWSSRAAFGRFGLSNVLSDSNVNSYLAANPKLYPKLYRYRFDPNRNVRQSMNDIWNALIKDPSRAINDHFQAIVEDLLVSMLHGKDWRARQASCAAMSDLIQGRPPDEVRATLSARDSHSRSTQVQPYLNRIWSICFKVLDDIKESVRNSATELARILSNTLIRNLESRQGASQTSNGMLSVVLPFLLSTSGLESSAKDVREQSLSTLLQIIKKAGPGSLRPFIPELVEKLLALLTLFEPEAVNYVYLNAANYDLKQEDIDEMRLKGIRSSPLMEAIERCLDMLDETTTSKLVPRLIYTLLQAVGNPTKVTERPVCCMCFRKSEY